MLPAVCGVKLMGRVQLAPAATPRGLALALVTSGQVVAPVVSRRKSRPLFVLAIPGLF